MPGYARQRDQLGVSQTSEPCLGRGDSGRLSEDRLVGHYAQGPGVHGAQEVEHGRVADDGDAGEGPQWRPMLGAKGRQRLVHRLHQAVASLKQVVPPLVGIDDARDDVGAQPALRVDE